MEDSPKKKSVMTSILSGIVLLVLGYIAFAGTVLSSLWVLFLPFYILFLLCKLRAKYTLTVIFSCLTVFVLQLSMYDASLRTWAHVYNLYSTSGRHNLLIAGTFVACFPLILTLMTMSTFTYFFKVKRGSISAGIAGGLLAVALIMIVYYFWGWTDYMFDVWDPVFLKKEP